MDSNAGRVHAQVQKGHDAHVAYVAGTGSGMKAGKFYAQQEGKRKLSPPRPSGNHHGKDVAHNGALDSHLLAESPLQSGPMELYHPILEEGPANSKLSSSTFVKVKKGIARSRAHQTSIKNLDGSSATLHSVTNNYPLAANHGKLTPSVSHKLQLESGVRLEMEFQFKGGSVNIRRDTQKLGFFDFM